MKKYITSVLILALITGCSYAQSGWFWLNHGMNGTFEDIVFANDSVAYLNATYQSNLYCLKTTNKGMNWLSNIVPGAYPSRQGIFFLNENTGWITSGFGGIWKTTNDGSNWIKLPYPNTTDIVGSVWFINPATGFVGGSFGINKTTNDGQNWVNLNVFTNTHVGDIVFIIQIPVLLPGMIYRIPGG